jgi:LytR cell envelope-related transcriptional attenuator
MTALLLVVLLAAAAIGGWWLTQREPDRVEARPRVSCPPPEPTPATVPPTSITVNVYNATDRKGLAARVAAELTKRRFRVGKVDNDPLERKVTGVAEVRASQAGDGAARTVGAHAGEVVAVPDQRKNASVDLVVGARFTALRTPAQAKAALVPTPAPRPSGC